MSERLKAPVISTIGKYFLAGLLLCCVTFSSGCLGLSNQDASTQELLGYRFEPDQQLVRGADDEVTSLAGGGGSEPTSPSGVRKEPTVTVSDTTRAPVSPTKQTPEHGSLLVERPTKIGPTPFPEEWMSPQSGGGIFESWTRVTIMAILLLLIAVSAIGVLRNW